MAIGLVAANVQLTVPNLLVATLLEKVICTDVVEIVPGELSVSVPVHVVVWLIATVVGRQLTWSDVLRLFTVIPTVLLGPLTAWVVSPP